MKSLALIENLRRIKNIGRIFSDPKPFNVIDVLEETLNEVKQL